MDNNIKLTINGLLDGVFVSETNNTIEQPYIPSSKIYNENEPADLGISFYEKNKLNFG